MHIKTVRLEAFSDGVISILITLMVFDIKFPDLAHDFTHHDVMMGLRLVTPKLIAYLFSFLVLGTMWVNHHHLYHLVQVVDEKLLWLNLNLLFWMSLIPFPTAMIGKNYRLPESAALYGAVLFMTALSLTLMRHYVIRKELTQQQDRKLDRAVTRVNRRARIKNFIGTTAYLLSIPAAYISVFLSFGLFLIPPVLFFIPDGVDQVEAEVINKEQ